MTTEPKPKRQTRSKTVEQPATQNPAPAAKPDTEQDKANQTLGQPNANPEQPAATQEQSEGTDLNNGQQDKAPVDSSADPEQPAGAKDDASPAAAKVLASPLAEPATVAVAVKPVHAIEVTNHSTQRVFEPVTRTSIEPGETKTIECINASFKQRALSNLKQFQALGRKVEIKEDASST